MWQAWAYKSHVLDVFVPARSSLCIKSDDVYFVAYEGSVEEHLLVEEGDPPFQKVKRRRRGTRKQSKQDSTSQSKASGSKQKKGKQTFT